MIFVVIGLVIVVGLLLVALVSVWGDKVEAVRALDEVSREAAKEIELAELMKETAGQNHLYAMHLHRVAVDRERRAEMLFLECRRNQG